MPGTEVKPPKPGDPPSEKYFYLPGTIIWDVCPKCRREVQRDLARHYLLRPPFNARFQIGMYCEPCDIRWNVDAFLNVRLEILSSVYTFDTGL